MTLVEHAPHVRTHSQAVAFRDLVFTVVLLTEANQDPNAADDGAWHPLDRP